MFKKMKFVAKLMNCLKEERGSQTIEYLIIILVIIVIAGILMAIFPDAMEGIMTGIIDKIKTMFSL